jgi:TRAP-type C4-dicarboxylate transport system substrate-binding protein
MVGLPFEVPSPSATSAVLVEFLKAGYLKELTDNFKPLAFTPMGGFTLFTCDKKVTTLEDMKGLKIDAPPPLYSVYEKMGAIPVNIPAAEEYISMERGTVDGSTTGVDNVVSSKYYEVIKYAINDLLMAGSMCLIMNKSSWDSLPSDLQAIVEKAGEDMTAGHDQMNIDNLAEWWGVLPEKGVEVYSLTKEEKARWKELTSDAPAEYVKEWSAKGYPAQEALDLMREVSQKYQ